MFVCLSILRSTILPSSTTRKKHVWVIPFPEIGIGTNGINSFHFLCVLWIPPLIELRHRQWQIAIAQCVLQQQKRHVQKHPLDRHACAVQQRSRHNRPRTITRQTHRAFRRQFSRPLITNSSERPIIERSNNRYFGNDLLGTCSLHFTCQQYKGSNVMITIICLKIVYH